MWALLEAVDHGHDEPAHEANRAYISQAPAEVTLPQVSHIDHAFDDDMVAALVLDEIAHRNVVYH